MDVGVCFQQVHDAVTGNVLTAPDVQDEEFIQFGTEGVDGGRVDLVAVPQIQGCQVRTQGDLGYRYTRDMVAPCGM